MEIYGDRTFQTLVSAHLKTNLRIQWKTARKIGGARMALMVVKSNLTWGDIAVFGFGVSYGYTWKYRNKK